MSTKATKPRFRSRFDTAEKLRMKVKFHQLVLLANDSGEGGAMVLTRLRGEWEPSHHSAIVDNEIDLIARDAPRYDGTGEVFGGLSGLFHWLPRKP